MFFSKNFTNFISSKISAQSLRNYMQASFKDVTSSLSQVMGRIRSRLSCFNASASIFDMMLQDFDPENLSTQLVTGVGVNKVCFETAFGDEIISGVKELVPLVKESELGQTGSKTDSQYDSVSLVGPDGKEYDIVILPDEGLELATLEYGNIIVYLSTCEAPTELADCILFKVVDTDKMMINPMLRSVDFMNGEYDPNDSYARLLLWMSLRHIPYDPSDTMHYNITLIAEDEGIEYVDDLATMNYVLNDIYDQGYVDNLDDAIRLCLEAQYHQSPMTAQGAVCFVGALASALAEKASIDTIHNDIGSIVLHQNFNSAAISSLLAGLNNARNSISSILTNINIANATGGVTGVVSYLVEYYSQESKTQSDDTNQVWVLTDQATLVPKNFVANIGTIFLQVFGALAQVIGAFFGFIGVAIGSVLNLGCVIASKFINFVNDKGRAFYVSSPNFLAAANISIFQGYVNAQSFESRILALLNAHTTVYTQVPGGLVILSLDSARSRVVIDVHPLLNSININLLKFSYQTIEAHNYIEVAINSSWKDSLAENYANYASSFSLSYDPSASAVQDADKDIRSAYLSGSSDSLAFNNIRKNSAIFYIFLSFLGGYGDTYGTSFGLDASFRQVDNNLFTAFILQGFFESDLAAKTISNNWGFGNWTDFIGKCSKVCAFTKSLWDPDVPAQDVLMFWDHWVADTSDFYRQTYHMRVDQAFMNVANNAGDKILTDITEMHPEAQFALIAPKWDAASIWATLIGATIVSAIVAAAVVVSSVVIKKKITSARASRQASVEQAWSEYAKDPGNAELYKNYRKAVRKNNVFAKVFGGTQYSKNNYWETVGGEDSTIGSELLNNQTLTTMNTSETGTDVNPYNENEIKRLIAGEYISSL